MEPIHREIIRTKKELLKDVATIAGMDRGCSLTKVLYIPKEETDPDYYDLTCVTFLNSNFYDGLMWLIANARLPTSGEICVTGVGCDKFRELIEEKTGLKVRFVDEMFTMIKGNYFLIKNFPNSFISTDNPPIAPEINKISGLMRWIAEHSLQPLVQLNADKELNPPTEEIRLPALVATFGSASGICEIGVNGEAKLAGGTMMCGRTMMGLSKLLLKTTNYEEIMKLAEKGDITVVGKTASQVSSSDEGSQYKQEYNFPLFPFGNVTQNTKLSDLKKEDVAIALIDFMVSHLYFTLAMSASVRKINRIYIGGNVLRSPILQRLFCEKVAFYGMNLLEVHFLKTGHSGAIGAMISKAEEDEKFEMKF